MGGRNFYQEYYNGNYATPKPGIRVRQFYKGKAGEMSASQREYHEALIKFMESKGIETTIFRKPRDSRDCHRKISGMITTLRKQGLDKEFFGKEGMNAVSNNQSDS